MCNQLTRKTRFISLIQRTLKIFLKYSKNTYLKMLFSLNTLKFALLISLIIVVFLLLNNNKMIEQLPKETKSQIKLNIFDLSQPIEQNSIYGNISCRKSAKYVVETTLCVNDYKIDFVSSIIWNNGAFEGHILGI